MASTIDPSILSQSGAIRKKKINGVDGLLETVVNPAKNDIEALQGGSTIDFTGVAALSAPLAGTDKLLARRGSTTYSTTISLLAAHNLLPRVAVTDTSGTDVEIDPTGTGKFFFEASENLDGNLSLKPKGTGQLDGITAVVLLTGTAGAFTFKVTGLVYPTATELEANTDEAVVIQFTSGVGWYALGKLSLTTGSDATVEWDEVKITGSTSITFASHASLYADSGVIKPRILKVRRSSDVAITLTMPNNLTSEEWGAVRIQIDDDRSSTVTISRDSAGDINGANSVDMAAFRGAAVDIWLRNQETGPDVPHYTATGDLAESTSLYGNMDASGFDIIDPVLKNFGITRNALGSQSGGITADYEDGQTVTVTLSGNATGLTISNPPPSGTEGSISFIIDHGSGPFTWAHPSGVVWGGGNAPTLSDGANEISVLTYTTEDGGSTWYGFFGGQDFS